MSLNSQSPEEEAEFQKRLKQHFHRNETITVGEILTIKKRVEEEFAVRAAGAAVREAANERR